jgi:hypothetical protein
LDGYRRRLGDLNSVVEHGFGPVVRGIRVYHDPEPMACTDSPVHSNFGSTLDHPVWPQGLQAASQSEEVSMTERRKKIEGFIIGFIIIVSVIGTIASLKLAVGGSRSHSVLSKK